LAGPMAVAQARRVRKRVFDHAHGVKDVVSCRLID